MDIWKSVLFLDEQLQIKEAKEVTDESEGRWVPFNITGSDFCLLEKKGLPQHLQSIENLDVPVTLKSLLNDLEDAGEVTRLETKPQFRLNVCFVWPCNILPEIYTYAYSCSPRWKLRYHTTASSMEIGRTANHLSFWWMNPPRMEGWKRRRKKTKRKPNWLLRILGPTSASPKPSLRKCCAWDFAAGFLDGIWKIQPWIFVMLRFLVFTISCWILIPASSSFTFSLSIPVNPKSKINVVCNHFWFLWFLVLETSSPFH